MRPNLRGPLGRAWERITRTLLGKRLESEAEAEERVGVGTGLPILASDNVSSSAYATEEAMRILAIAGVAALSLTLPIALAVVFVLAIVVLSESRVIRAYPNGGGSYLVARENHGVIAGLVAASALLIDYVLTVAVSAAAGVAAISSFLPELHDQRVVVGLAFIALLAVVETIASEVLKLAAIKKTSASDQVATELAALRNVFKGAHDRYMTDATALKAVVGSHVMAGNANGTEWAAWFNLAQMLLNLDETITKP